MATPIGPSGVINGSYGVGPGDPWHGADPAGPPQQEGVPLAEIAVLFRSGHHSAALELELARANLPFKKHGGIRFTEAAARYLQGDASTRSYARLLSKGRSAVLMNSPRQPIRRGMSASVSVGAT